MPDWTRHDLTVARHERSVRARRPSSCTKQGSGRQSASMAVAANVASPARRLCRSIATSPRSRSWKVSRERFKPLARETKISSGTIVRAYVSANRDQTAPGAVTESDESQRRTRPSR
jgi:hypothetical protein